ncbi:tetratricopeptide repeat protein [Acidisphaera sp. L21]|uniref:tetratricopeptide repeat protein n=1 Tax=Acidisphaera sp. L21 TaxID=1641851 RepID=UPI00131B7368|nr:tetratricopeptide repeat-containing glycosyltransferase family protein [Acidisphaera sp. L21]
MTLGLNPALQDLLAIAAQQNATGQLDAAAASYSRALSMAPGNAEIANNLGVALWGLDRLDDATAAFCRAIHLHPDFAEAHNNLGTALRDSGLPDEARRCFETAVEIRPDYAQAHGNLGMAMLAEGDYPAGWAEYEWRWRIPAVGDPGLRFGRPRWRGEDMPGRRLLIHAEQGLGDTLQFCRLGTAAAARGLAVSLVVPQPLVRLLQGLEGVTVAGPEDPLPHFDLICPMMSLPLALGLTLDTIPSPVPYLWADDGVAATWAARLHSIAGPKLRVGVAWSGNARLAADRRRSVAPALLARLADIEDVQFISLQKGGASAPAEMNVIDWMHLVGDFADTAALVANLDLVIAVDSAVAHLAASLGKPIWLLDRLDSCWRWLAGRRDSPWYPTLRIYRQSRAGVWDDVLDAVTYDLYQLAVPVMRALRHRA